MSFASLGQRLSRIWHGAWSFASRHLFISLLILAAIGYGGYRAYAAYATPVATTQYVTAAAATSTVVATMTESGQVSTSKTLNLTPQTSGQVVYVGVKPGDHVAAGQLIAQLDTTSAQQALTDAQLSLKQAELTYEQDTATATAITLLTDRSNVSNAQTALIKAHDNAYADIGTIYTDLSTVVSGLNTALYSYGVQGRANQKNIDAYTNLVSQQDDSIGIYANAANTSYTKAYAAYQSAVADYKNTSQTISNDQLITLAQETYTAAQTVAEAARQAYSFYDRVSTDFTLYNLGAPSQLTSLVSQTQGYNTTAATDMSNALSDKSSLVSAEQALAQAQNQLTTDEAGPTQLTTQTAALNLQKAQEAVATAQTNLNDCYVRAPFAGTIGAVNVQTYDQASSGTTIATLVTNKMTADITVNEVDASKLKVGQQATLTFDALPNVTIAGTVSSINPIGSASQGVVSYDATIAFDTQNTSILPGMSVTANIITGTQTGVAVPSSAIKTQGTTSYVQVLSGASSSTPGAGRPRNVPVTTGLTDNTNTIITSGVTAGTKVVTQTIASTNATTPSSAARSTSLFGGGGGGFRRVGG